MSLLPPTIINIKRRQNIVVVDVVVKNERDVVNVVIVVENWSFVTTSQVAGRLRWIIITSGRLICNDLGMEKLTSSQHSSSEEYLLLMLESEQ